MLIARGEVEAGINLDELEENDVEVEEQRVTITLPEVRILETNLIEEKTRLYDVDQGIFSKGDYSLVEQARLEAVEKIEQAARDENLREQARDNAEDGIRSFITSLGYEEVVFTS